MTASPLTITKRDGALGTDSTPAESSADQGVEEECGARDHGAPLTARYSLRALAKAVGIFKALGDEARLQTLTMLIGREACVSELAAATGERVSTVSHRLRLLRSEALVERRREGRHIYYTLADAHVFELVRNALDHATERD